MVIREVKRKVIEKCLYGSNTVEDYIFEIPKVINTTNFIMDETHNVTVEAVAVEASC